VVTGVSPASGAAGGHLGLLRRRLVHLRRLSPRRLSQAWTQLPPVPSPVSDCGVAVVGGRLIVVGGESIGTVFDTVRAFDLTTSTWSILPPLAAARHGEAVTAIGNTLYAIDGAALPGHNASTNTLQILTFHG
jgi:Kelch motif